MRMMRSDRGRSWECLEHDLGLSWASFLEAWGTGQVPKLRLKPGEAREMKVCLGLWIPVNWGADLGNLRRNRGCRCYLA